MIFASKEKGPIEVLIEIVKDLLDGKNKPTIFH